MADQAAADRLKAAREAADFASAKEAAEAMGVPVPSYIQHENGTRGFKRDRAAQYARRFRTTPEWLLFGRGKAPEASAEPSANELEQMIREAMQDVVTFETRISDFPRIVAPILHEQLERYRAENEDPGTAGERTSRGRGAQSPQPTKRAV